ncbi:DUF397 domain-containing protein [Streptomyces sp. SD11]|uniref:DUF397 domain-containing protein n=1 Tax=Streptomyces sp. SD11 TaxID=3452209 RepID=UPI003F88C375
MSSSERLAWTKSSYSGSDGGNCVEVAAGPEAVYVRDSKVVGDGTVLRVRRGQWGAFIAFAVG